MRILAMRKTLTSIAALAACAVAAASDLLVRPQYGDPTLLSPGYSKSNTNAFSIATAFLPGGNTNFTSIIWGQAQYQGDNPAAFTPFVMMNCSYRAARATLEGGATLPNLCSHDETQPLPLVGGTWAENCLTQSYAHPDTCNDWQYGCYCFNITTDTPLTLNVGGEELYIAATNGMIRNVKAPTASRSVSIAAENPSATVRFGIAENPLRQFIGGQNDGMTTYGVVAPGGGGMSTNEWRMFVFRAAIEGSALRYEIRAYSPSVQLQNVDSSSNEMWQPVAAFEKDARIRIMCCILGGLNNWNIAVWGFRVYNGWLPDALLETMRDQDAAELARRGMM